MRLLGERPLRLPRLRPYVPKPEDPPIFWFNSERDDIVREVVRRVFEKHGGDPTRIEYALNDTAYNEARRLETQRDSEAKQSLGYWRGLVRRIARLSEDEKKDALHHICERMAKDVAGNFDPRVYAASVHVVPHLLRAVMKPSALPKELLHLHRNTAPSEDLVTTQGDLEKLRRLAKIGTLILVPTHASNLDSVALGFALQRSDLPPVVYGAGKNLFTNPIISFFMHNLGAYRVDRRIRAGVYKDVLKTYSCVMIERGYHSLFFPGGTRSRSGLIERHLKLGLAGSAVEAFSRNQVRGVHRPVYFVPATINYALVLEAETLIEDHLKESGKARYIIEDDEFSKVDRWIDFFRRLTTMEAGCVIRFGDPVDPFCNPVDADGRSLTPRGTPIDPATYVSRDGAPVLDAARDAAYTAELGHELSKRYLSETVIMSTQLTAHILFRKLVRSTPGIDLYGRLRHRGDVTMTRAELLRELAYARDRILALEQEGIVHPSPFLRRNTPESILDRTLAAWNGYHKRVVARDAGSEITAEDPTILLYYQNRLVPFATRIAGDEHKAAAREIAALGGHG